MTLFIDSANISEIEKWLDRGVAKGITTNPNIIFKEGKIDYMKHLQKLWSYGVPVSVELTKTENYDTMLKEALDLKKNCQDPEALVIKVPMLINGVGLELAEELENSADLKVNLTCLMSTEQFILACQVGVTYASLFYGRMKDYWRERGKALQNLSPGAGENAAEKIFRECVFVQRKYEDYPLLIAGSIREPEDVVKCMNYGADVVTVPPKILEKMMFHEKTESTIAEFDESWKKFKAENKL